MQSFRGLAKYLWQKPMENFFQIAKPLTELTKKNNAFCWMEKHTKNFEQLKELLCKAPALRYPDYASEFTLTTYASNVGFGAVLFEEGTHTASYHAPLIEQKKITPPQRKSYWQSYGQPSVSVNIYWGEPSS